MATRRRLFLSLALVAACGRSAFTGPQPGISTPTPALPGWSFYRVITVSGAGLSTPLSGFPVPVVLDSGIDLSAAQPGGADLRFLDDTNTLLDYEVDAWNPGTPGENSVLWVLSPQIEPGSGTSFRMFWGNPGAAAGQDAPLVWSSAGFAAVWHLGTNLTASTGIANDITGVAAADAPGLFGRGRKFSGTTGQYLSVPDNDSLDPTTAITISAWVNPVAWGGDNRIVEKGAPLGVQTNDDQYRLSQQKNGSVEPIEFLVDKVGDADTGTTYSTVGGWHHMAATYDGVELLVYVDGEEAAHTAATGPIPVTTTPLYIGAKESEDGTADDFFDGTIDEVRLSPTARSAEWILAEYEGGAGTLVTIGPQVSMAPVGDPQPDRGPGHDHHKSGNRGASGIGGIPLGP